MGNKLTAAEKVDAIKAVYNILKLLTDEEALVGIILKPSTYEGVRALFGPGCRPFNPSGLHVDDAMENAFVIDGMLVLKGTTLQ